MDLDTITGLLRLAVIIATPIALGAYAEIISERAGTVNIAIEGMMLTFFPSNVTWLLTRTYPSFMTLFREYL